MTRDLRRMAVGHDPGFLRDRLEQAEGGLLLAERGGHPGWGADPRRPRGRGRGPGPWAVAGAFVGTVIGAGFASGQETLRFFTAFGPAGLAGLGLATVLFIVCGARVLALGARLGAASQRPLVCHALGPKAGPAMDVLLAAVLLASAAAMASGAASAMAEQFGWPRWLGAAVMMAASGGTVLGGVRGVVAALAAVAPLLVVSILLVSSFSLGAWPPGAGPAEGPAAGLARAWRWAGAPELGAVRWWWSAAVLYVSYNMLLALPVLAPLGARAAGDGAGDGRRGGPGRSERRGVRRGGRRGASGGPGAGLCGAALGGLGLGVGAAAIHLAVAAHMPGAAAADIPMLFAARALPSWVAPAYSILLLAEVYTTAVGLLFGFAARMGEEGGRRFRLAAAGGAAAACVGGLVPFARVVGGLYPVLGVLGLLVLAGLWRPAGR